MWQHQWDKKYEQPEDQAGCKQTYWEEKTKEVIHFPKWSVVNIHHSVQSDFLVQL